MFPTYRLLAFVRQPKGSNLIAKVGYESAAFTLCSSPPFGPDPTSRVRVRDLANAVP